MGIAPVRNLYTSMWDSPMRRRRTRGHGLSGLCRRDIVSLQRIQGEKNEHFFELFEICGGLDANLLERNAGPDFRDGSDGLVARKDAVHTAGDDALAHAHVIVV